MMGLSSAREAKPENASRAPEPKSTAPAPPANTKSVAFYPSESTNMNIKERKNSISVKPAAPETTPPFPVHNPSSAQFLNYPGMWYLVYAAALLYMFPSLVSLVSLKFQNKSESAFEAHGFLANLAVVAYIIAVSMSVGLFRLKASSTSENLSPTYFMILESVFYFWCLLAPLSFVLVVFLPHGFAFIEYSLVVILFLIVAACSTRNYICICKKDALNMEAHKRNEA